MELVACTPADLPARMNEVQWQSMWRYYILPGQVKPLDSSFEASARAHDFLLEACLIAVDEGHDAGFCWGALRGDEAWCGGFGVRPEFRRRGLGKRLLQATADALRQAGAKVWRLEVVQHNRGAVDSYHAAGFRSIRDLGLLRGRIDVPLEEGEQIVDCAASECLGRYPDWPQIRRTWGATPDRLRANQDHYQARTLLRRGEPVAHLLYGGTSVVDLGYAPGEPGRNGLKLLSTLPSFSAGNLPDDDPVRAELERCPGVECWVKQWEMEWVL